MPDFPLLEGGRCTTYGNVAGTTTGTTVPASASANTKGSWTQLTASTSHEASWVMVTIKSATAARFLMDLGIGAAGSEQVLIPNLYLDCATAPAAHNQILLPLSVPNGSRLSARCQSSTGGATVVTTVTLVAPTWIGGQGLAQVVDLGTNTATSGTTQVDPGSPANSKGAWTQLAASTPFPINWLVILFGHNATTLSTTLDWLIDIGVGAGGSEQVIWSNQHVRVGSAMSHASPDVINLPKSIPAGSRIAARCQCSANTATARLIDVQCYGVG